MIAQDLRELQSNMQVIVNNKKDTQKRRERLIKLAEEISEMDEKVKEEKIKKNILLFIVFVFIVAFFYIYS